MGVWSKHSKLWAPALALLVLNLGALAAYRLVYAGRAEAREARVDRASATLREMETRRQRAEEYLADASTSAEQVETFLNERLGRQEERLTEIIGEVKALARAAGLEPSQINYRSEAIEEQGLVRRSLLFAVAGGYLDLRKLVNLLELSESFITLEQVSLSETDQGGRELRINLQLAALFFDPAVQATGAGDSSRRATR